MDTGNKELTNYFRIKKAILNRQVVIALAIMFLFLSHLFVYTLGRIQGWDKAVFYAEKNFEKSLHEAIDDGRDFRLRDMDIRFYPRADGGANVAVLRTINKRIESDQVHK